MTLTLKLVETFSNLGKCTPQMHFYGKLDIYVMKNRLIRYLWILKQKIKYMFGKHKTRVFLPQSKKLDLEITGLVFQEYLQAIF
jgi:hypothetical protein